jgi:peptidoglycan/xylan/chitin deacetylase (PgdA/CDA1 family)
MNPNAIKRSAARVFDVLGINSVGHYVQRTLLFPFVRVVNYHHIPDDLSDNFERQLQFYSSRFVNVGYQDLEDLLQTGRWLHKKPGLIISFDDGYRSHYEKAAPLLEKYGFTGWFFVPAVLAAEQNGRPDDALHMPVDEALTREELLQLSAKHIVGCHTYSHRRLTADLSLEQLQHEIPNAQKPLEQLLGRPIRSFCWVGGEEYTYTKPAAELVRENYDLGFMTNNAIVRPNTNKLQLQRTNIEAENPLWLVRFQISGLLDIFYFPKRRRVNRLTG